MVKRYDSPSRKAKLLKDMPFYYRYPKQMITIAILAPMFYLYGPVIFRFFFPPPAGRYMAFDPRREENLSILRQKFMERESSLKNISK